MITVDISNIWGELSLPELLEAEKEVFDAHMMLTDGNGPGGAYLGWLHLPVKVSWQLSMWHPPHSSRLYRGMGI